MKLNIFTDPHLGVSRQAHTTRDSSRRLNDALFRTAMKARSSECRNVIAGDLFDKTNNPEWVTVQGMQVASDALLLGGNHDETNREGTKSSLDVISEADVATVIRQETMSEPFFDCWNGMYFVPHHATQELFITALYEAMSNAEVREGNKYLFVHCNRHSVPGDRADSTLLIDQEMEDKLLEVFTRIFYGHIHQPNHSTADGSLVSSRVVVLGNTHPTSFSDISNKYRYELDPETDELTAYLLWEKTRSRILPLGSPPEELDADFIEITGEGTRKQVSDYVQQVWESNPEALAVRPNVTYLTEEGKEIQDVDLTNLSDQIREDLKDSDLIDLYNELDKELQA